MNSPREGSDTHLHKLDLTLVGHLFDENIINDMLNAVESYKGYAHVLELKLGTTTEELSQARVEMLLEQEVDGLYEQIKNMLSTKPSEIRVKVNAQT